MDLAETLQRKSAVESAPGTEEIELSESERAEIVNELITKGVYREEVNINSVGLKVVFRTRTTKEEREIKDRFERDGGIPSLLPDFYFKLGLYSLVYSLESVNGNPITLEDSFDKRLEEISEKIPAPIMGKIIEEFFKFEKKVLMAVDPSFLERLSRNIPLSGQE